MKRKLRKIAFLFVLACISFGITSFLFSQGKFSELSLRINDFFYSDSLQESGNIVIVSIDDKSLQDSELGRWQDWKRDYYAKVVDLLQKSGAKAIGVDVLFTEASKNDELLEKTVRETPSVVLASKTDLPRPEHLFTETNWGFVDIPLDQDGVARSVKIDEGTQLFSIQLLKTFLGVDEKTVLEKNILTVSSEAVRPAFNPMMKVEAIHIPVFNNRIFINYFGKPRTFERVSFSDVYFERVTPETFKNKIVLIGEDGAGLFDEQTTPLSHGIKMPGVEIHANMIETMLQGKYLHEQSASQFYIITAILVFLSVFFFAYQSIWKGVLWLVIGGIIFIAVATVSFALGFIIYGFYISIAYVLSFLGVFFYRYFSEEKEKKFIKQAFSKYVSPELLEELSSQKEIKLGGDRKTLTVFFSDIEGFTTLSERMDAEALVNLLNEYLTVMTDIILNEKGTVDKYEGDAIMAFWGAPVSLEKHAYHACRSAILCKKGLKKLCTEWAKKDLPQLGMRIGVNTGEMIVGNIGSKNRFDYTVIGDSVNLGSRLEGVNKEYGTSIIISEDTFKELSNNEFLVRPLDKVRVKGKQKPIAIFELINFLQDASDEEKHCAGEYKKALELYYAQRFDEAKKIFDHLETQCHDKASEVMSKRCDKFIRSGAPLGWDGVFEMLTK